MRWGSAAQRVTATYREDCSFPFSLSKKRRFSTKNLLLLLFVNLRKMKRRVKLWETPHLLLCFLCVILTQRGIALYFAKKSEAGSLKSGQWSSWKAVSCSSWTYWSRGSPVLCNSEIFKLSRPGSMLFSSVRCAFCKPVRICCKMQ
jgi:hypothetical protein